MTTLSAYESEVQPRPKLGPRRADLDGLLAANAEKSARERLTLMRLFEELRGRGYQGGYDAVRRYAKAWKRAHGVTSAVAYVPLSFAPGEAYQFDWSHEIVLIRRRDGDGEGGPCPPLPQPDDFRTGLSAQDAGDVDAHDRAPFSRGPARVASTTT